MTAPSQLRPFIEREINAVTYVIAYEEESRRVTYISTNDEDFRTVDGLQVGHYMTVGREQMVVYPGWEIRVMATRDGWYPVIGFNSELMVNYNTGLDFNVHLNNLSPNETIRFKIIGFVRGGN